MNPILNRPKILYFSNPENKAGNAVRALLEQMPAELVVRHLENPERISNDVDSYQPALVLADYFSSFGVKERIVDRSKEMLSQVPSILIIDEAVEEEAVELVQKGVQDYVFQDRLKKLPVLVEQILKNSGEKLQKPVVHNDQNGNYGSTPSDKKNGQISSEEFEKRSTQVVHQNGQAKKLERSGVSGIPVFSRRNNEVAPRNQEPYRSFFQNSPDGILVSITGGEILAANPAACKMFKMTEAEICASRQIDLMDMADSRLIAAIKEREQKGKARATVTLIRKGGTRFEGEVTSVAFKNSRGEDRTSIIIRDISEKQRARQKLEKSEENYKKLFQHNPLASMIFDLDTLEVLDVNQAAVDLYGYSRDEFLKIDIAHLRPEDNRAGFEERIRQARNTSGTFSTGLVQHIAKDGNLIKVDVHTHSLDFENRNCRVAVLNNVTEKEALFEEVEEKNNQLAAAQSLAKLGYWELDLANNRLFWSDQVYKIWEKDKNRFTPTTEYLINSIHPDFKDKFADRMSLSNQDEVKHDIEYKILLESGTSKWIRGKGSLKRSKDGTPLSFGGILQDVTEQREVQERLKRSESRHKGILMSQTNYLIRTDLSGRFTYCNEKFVDDFGWLHCQNDFSGLEALASVEPYHREKVIQSFGECLENPNEVFQVEIDKLQRGDEKKITLWDMVCLTDEAGQPFEVQCVGIDITKRVQAEESLQESNERYEIISKATSDAIYDWDCRTGKMDWSEGFKKLFGHEPISSIAFWASRLHPDEKEKIEQDLERALSSSTDKWQGEYRFRKANGEYAVVEEKGTIIRNEEQVAERMLGAIKDITEKKKYEETLKKKERNLKTAQKIAGLGYWELDIQNCSIFWNEQTYEVWGRELNDGAPTLEETLSMVHWEDVEKYTKEFKAALERGEDHELEHRIITPEGKTKWLHHRGTTIFDKEGRPLKMEGTVQDITARKLSDLKLLQLNDELKRYTKELIAANKGLEQFSYIVSHNLRSPVANITGLADLIRNGEYEDEIKEKFLAELYVNVQRLDNVIIDLNKTLQLKKKITEKKEPVRFQDLVNAIKGSIHYQITKENVVISTCFEVTYLNTVMSYMHSIFYNLITNSIKYRRQDVSPVIKISSKVESDKVVVVFEDNGLGIDLVKRGEQVFGLYKRFHHHVEGKGIGLFMVKTQVESLGGKISVFSEPGKGTKFVLEFQKQN